MSETGAEVPCTVSVWRTDDDGGHEEPVTVAGVYNGSAIAPVELSVWRDLGPPPPPTDAPSTPDRATFAASTITGASFNLEWSASISAPDLPILGYLIYMTSGDEPTNNGEGNPIDDGVPSIDVSDTEYAIVTSTVEAAVSSRLVYPLTGLIAGTIYTIWITAYNAAGESALSDPFQVQTLTAPVANTPNAPTNFRAPSIDTTFVNLAWTASTLPGGASAVTGYNIYNNGTQLLASVGVVTATQVTALTPDTAYALTIKAVNAAGQSPASSIVNVRTLSVFVPPATPTGLRVASVGSGYVALAWTANSDIIDGYHVYRAGVTQPVATVPNTATSATISGLTNGTSYTFHIRAYRAAETSAASATVTATPQAVAAVPSAPTGLTAVAGSQQVVLDWATNPTVDNVTAYQVFRGTTLLASPTVSAYTATGLINGTAYTFTVRAVNATGTSAASAPVTATPVVVVASALPYTADSFFKSRVDGGGVPINSARTTAFRNFMATYVDPDNQSQAAVTWPRINVSESWAMSYHVHKPGQTAPLWYLREGISPRTGQRVTFDPRVLITKTQGFHMADSVASTFPNGDQDRPGVMVDYQFGYTVQFADAVPNLATRTIEVSSANIMWHSSNGLDYRNPRSNDPRNFSSRGRIVDAMVIRRDTLDEAIAKGTSLGHCFSIYHCATQVAHGFYHPMIKAEDETDGWGAEGERFRMDPSINLASRGLTGAALVIARTLQQHGGYFGDNSGSVTQIKAARPAYYVGTNLTQDCLKGKVFWADMQIVQGGFQ